MSSLFKILVPTAGAVILLVAGIWLHRSNDYATNEPAYQASVLDTFQQDEVFLREEPEFPEVAAAPVPVFNPAPPPVEPIILPPPVPAPPVEVLAVPAPIVTAPLGVGGILANRPPEPPPAPPPVLTPPPAPPPAAPEVIETSSTTEITETASTTEEVVAEVPPSPAPPPAPQVVISEIFIDMVGGDTEEFIELYNPADTAFDLSTASIQYLSGGAASVASISKKNFAEGASIAAHGFYLIGVGGYTGSVAADLSWSQSLSNAGATVLLVGNREAITGGDDIDIIDRIAYGSGTLLLVEDLPVPLPPVGQSLERAGGYTGGFAARETPAPQSATAP